MTHSCGNIPYTNREFKKQKDNTEGPPKAKITQRLRADFWLHSFCG